MKTRYTFFVMILFGLWSVDSKAYLPADMVPVDCWVVHEPVENEYTDDSMGFEYHLECDGAAGLAGPSSSEVSAVKGAFENSALFKDLIKKKKRRTYQGANNVGHQAPISASGTVWLSPVHAPKSASALKKK